MLLYFEDEQTERLVKTSVDKFALHEKVLLFPSSTVDISWGQYGVWPPWPGFVFRQTCYMQHALMECARRNIDWLIALDLDELFILATSTTPTFPGLKRDRLLNLRGLLHHLEQQNIRVVVFPSLEAVPSRATIDAPNPFLASTSFKINDRMLAPNTLGSLGLQSHSERKGLPRWLLGHDNGKTLIRVVTAPKNQCPPEYQMLPVCVLAKVQSPHTWTVPWASPNESFKQRAFVLHYFRTTFPLWLVTYQLRALDKETKWGEYYRWEWATGVNDQSLASFLATQDRNALRDEYERLMLPTNESVQSWWDKGLLALIPHIPEVLERVQQRRNRQEL
eukprot:c17498_g1_i3.p1 GENE.c17498_g1_i3~~c17498_g1_i3.p1  ORF type:complete len:335 (+),score=60.83 c17498_g1_i3:238-1242(+)